MTLNEAKKLADTNQHLVGTSLPGEVPIDWVIPAPKANNKIIMNYIQMLLNNVDRSTALKEYDDFTVVVVKNIRSGMFTWVYLDKWLERINK